MASPAQADTLVSSLEGTETPSYACPPGTWLASSFQTATQTWTLSSITVQAAETNLALRLYSSNGSNPGVAVADLKLVSLDPFASRATFAPSTPLTLSPSNTFWVAAGNTSGEQYLSLGINDSGSFPFSAVGGASMAYSLSEAFSLSNAPASWPAANSGSALLFQVDGSPVATAIVRPNILPLTLSGTDTLVRFQSQAGVTYVLQTTGNLNSPAAWMDISTNSGTGNLLSIPVPAHPAAAQRFFRLRVPVP